MCRDNPHDALNYAPPTGATFECIRKNVGASPYAILCRPYGTCHSRNFPTGLAIRESFTGQQYLFYAYCSFHCTRLH